MKLCLSVAFCAELVRRTGVPSLGTGCSTVYRSIDYHMCKDGSNKLANIVAQTRDCYRTLSKQS